MQAYDSIPGIVCSEKTTGLHTVSLVREVHDVVSAAPILTDDLSSACRTSLVLTVETQLVGRVCNLSHGRQFLLHVYGLAGSCTTYSYYEHSCRAAGACAWTKAEVGFGAQNRPFWVQLLLCVYQGSEDVPGGSVLRVKERPASVNAMVAAANV